jgi:hypothetical protein
MTLGGNLIRLDSSDLEKNKEVIKQRIRNKTMIAMPLLGFRYFEPSSCSALTMNLTILVVFYPLFTVLIYVKQNLATDGFNPKYTINA